MGLFGIISLILSATATAVGAVVQQRTAAAQARLQAQQASMQAASLREQADQEEQDQLMRSQVERRQSARKLAAAEAQYAAAGVSLSGTPTLSLQRMSEENEMETLMQEASSNRKRNLLLTDAWNTGKIGTTAAGLNRTAGTWGAIGTELTGAADLFGKGYTVGKKEGIWSGA